MGGRGVEGGQVAPSNTSDAKSFIIANCKARPIGGPGDAKGLCTAGRPGARKARPARLSDLVEPDITVNAGGGEARGRAGPGGREG